MKKLQDDELYPSEVLVLTSSMIEKILRRSLLQLMISAGHTSDDAFKLLAKHRGLHAIKNTWKFYDPQGRGLPAVIDNSNWQVIEAAAVKRNSLVHGIEHEDERIYKAELAKLLDTMDKIRKRLSACYGYDGWQGLKRRTVSALHTDPKVKT